MMDNQSVTSIFLSIKEGLAGAIAGIVPPKEIEDIVQETYVRVCQNENGSSIREPRRFLYKRAESRLTDSAEHEQDFFRGASDRYDATFAQVSINEEYSQFCKAVRHLPQQCRRVFVLKKVYGLSQREIARELSIKESTVEKHVAQGIKRCALYMTTVRPVPASRMAR